MTPKRFWISTWLILHGLVLTVPAFSQVENATEAEAAAQHTTFSFPNLGNPFLAKYCLDCHAGSEPAAGVPLDIFDSNERLIRERRVVERMSDLVRFSQMPPSDMDQPSKEETDSFLQLVQAILDDHDLNAPPNPGRVTMRRLNRNEYNNTVRDLVGIDFTPAEDFPADDVGHGFDNIGDVLSLSPLLMDRYLAAAESIVERAIMPNPPPPSKRWQHAKYCEPAGPSVPMDEYRPVVNAGSTDPIRTGPIHIPYDLKRGDYVFRTRVYAKRDDESDRPLKVAILLHQPNLAEAESGDSHGLSGESINSLKPFRIVKVLEVTARDEQSAQTLEVPLKIESGATRMAVAMFRPEEGESPATLYVQHLALEGPMDMRPESHHRLLGAPEASDADRTRYVIERFAKRAYRRALASDELDRLVSLGDSLMASGESWESAMQTVFQAILVSPKFLFRVELDENPSSTESTPINSFQLASRLSYFLWSTMPDDRLFELAESGELEAKLDEEIDRMLADPRSDQLVENFALQWLQVKRLEGFKPDPTLFPEFNDRLKQAMLQETRLFFTAIMREDRSLRELLDADFTFVNGVLARHYGITLDSGAGRRTEGRGSRWRERNRDNAGDFVRISLAKDSMRGGLLTHASVLTVTSNPTRTSPVKRGRWVLEQILGQPPPPPPPDVPELEEQKGELTGSLRERMEQHRANPSCASCHARMDPIGFAFENFDAIGRYRSKDGEFEIDPSGTLPGQGDFGGPSDLKQLLLADEVPFVRSFTEKMLIYALGRGLEPYDRPAVNRMVKEIKADGYRFSSLVKAIVKSEPFRMRRGG
jgi:hypothetical protein